MTKPSGGQSRNRTTALEQQRRARRAVADRDIEAIKAKYAGERTAMERAADQLIQIASSTPFLAFHALWFGAWVLWNIGVFGTRRSDPFPFGLITMVVSLEAIWLSIFVLMTQHRESAIAELR